jgi:diguanylate cyclase (GGDEF)-like protein
VLAICPAVDPKLVSLGASLAPSDILTIPVEEDELARRLELLGTLAALEAEKARREALFAPYLAGGAPKAAAVPQPDRRPQVCVLGEPSEAQVRVVQALPAATMSYAEDPAHLRNHLAGAGLDLVVVTRPASIAAALEAVNTAGEPARSPQLMAVHAGGLTAHDLPPQVDVLTLPVPPEILRTRLGLALRLASLRRWLRDPPRADGGVLLVDALSGLYNHGVLLDHLGSDSDGPGAALVAVELENLKEINARFGYAAGNHALAEIGRQLARLVRAEDLPARLGAGRFAVAVAVAVQAEAQLERIRLRIAQGLASSASLGAARVATGIEPLPLRGQPAERVARVFREFGRLRRAA